ncbi:MAG: MarR family winged helix-turn-helix transcriptional regulator [Pseudonocardiaceae bacterium]
MSGVARQRHASQRELGTWNQLVAFHARVSEMVEQALSERFGLSLSEYGALDALAKARDPEGIRMQVLSNAVGLNQSSVSRLVARLERQHLVERSLYEKDRRGVFTRITDAGRDLVTAAMPVYLQTLAAAFDRAIADPDLQELVTRMGR